MNGIYVPDETELLDHRRPCASVLAPLSHCQPVEPVRRKLGTKNVARDGYVIGHPCCHWRDAWNNRHNLVTLKGEGRASMYQSPKPALDPQSDSATTLHCPKLPNTRGVVTDTGRVMQAGGHPFPTSKTEV